MRYIDPIFDVLWFRVALAVLTILGASASHAQVQEYWTWKLNGVPMPVVCAGSTRPEDCPGTAAVRPIRSEAAMSFRTFGRQEKAGETTAGGYVVHVDQALSTTEGFAWMAFVWLDELRAPRQAILWQEGYDEETSEYKAGFAITVTAQGIVEAAIGAESNWSFALSSKERIGPYAWHHVALVWDTTRYHLIVDGRLQQSLDSRIVPDVSSSVPVALGAFYSDGNPAYVLRGALDEVKLVKFPIGSFVPSDLPAENFVLRERGLAFRNAVLQDMIAAGIISGNYLDLFATPSMASTSILRAWVNSFFTRARVDLPLDPLSADSEDYVYPIQGDADRPSLYRRLRDGERTGYCGAASIALRGVYKAFGYAPRVVDWMNSTDLEYTDSHAVVEVLVWETKSYLLQDPTYNLSGYDYRRSKYWSILDVYNATDDPPQYLPFYNDGFDFNLDPVWTMPTSEAYFSYFHSPSRVSNAWEN